ERIQQRLHVRRNELAIRFRVVFGQSFGQSDIFRIYLVDANAILEPAHDRWSDSRRIAALLERKLIIQRHPQLLANRKFKVWRHHADNRGGAAIDSNGLANDFRIGAEIALPDLVAENRHLFCAGLVIIGGEIASHAWRYAYDLEELIGHVTARV